MAFDEGLAQRLRERLGDDPAISEKKMFGGPAFLLRGNMCVSVHHDELLVRLDPDHTEAALARPGVRLFEMGGRSMSGWILVDPSVLAEDAELDAWVEEGRSFAASLPPK